MDTQHLEEISKMISYFLRHRPEELQISLDNEGWTDVDIFLNLLSQKLKKNIGQTELEQLINTSKKKRFEIVGNKIRALYGHSTKKISIHYPILTQTGILYHGTPTKNLESIQRQGLQKGQRNYIHLTNDRNLAYQCAQRLSQDVTILEIDATKFIKDGGFIYIASDEIYLTDAVPSKYILFPNQN